MNETLQETVQWYKEAKYGMMLHWGLYTLLGGEWEGARVRSYAEWAQTYFRIPNARYEKLAQAFNPVCFSAEDYVRLAQDCGMQYLVLTAKHHEGFAMYHSACSKFNVYDATPFHRDVLEEFAAACQKYGMRLGVYYSQDLDWHHPHGGGYLSDKFVNAGTTWDNRWDYPGQNKNFSICFEEKILPQVREMMTGYGDLCLVWFDVPMTISADQSKTLYDTVRALQPGCLINSRLGNGAYDYVSLGDNEIPERMEIPEGDIDYGDICGFKPSPYGLYETAATLNDTWGFSYYDHNWKSPETIAANKRHLNALGINYLLNIGPDPLGRIPAAAERVLREAAKL